MDRFIISRTDAIGDVVLTLPVAGLLKKHFPNCDVIFLGRNYVKDIVQACPDVDRFISWDTLDSLEVDDAVDVLKALHADTILHVKPHPKIARLAKKARIPRRIGTSRRWYHWLTCTQRVAFSRAKSDLHEAQLNLKLLKPLGISDEYSIAELVPVLHLYPKGALNEKVQAYLDPHRFNLLIHPLSHGHGREWPLNYYKALIHSLPEETINVIITGSKAERERLQKPLIDACPQAKISAGELSLDELMTLMKHADGILVGSTGPLHMAAAIGLRVLGLFPPKKVMNAHRWGPVGANTQTLMLEKNCDDCNLKLADQCACMRAITVTQVKDTILHWTTNRPAHNA